MNRKVNPITAVIIGIAVVLVVGLLTSRLFGGASSGGQQIVLPKPNMSDPHYQPDPRLAGGSGSGT
jgi:hypothetical protein